MHPPGGHGPAEGSGTAGDAETASRLLQRILDHRRRLDPLIDSRAFIDEHQIRRNDDGEPDPKMITTIGRSRCKTMLSRNLDDA